MIAIITHTPLWVFALLLVLIALGVQSLRDRTVSLPRLLIVPAVFIVWGLLNFATRAAASSLLAADWLVAGAIGVALAWHLSFLDSVQIDAATRGVTVPGSRAPLVRNLSIFLAKYAAGVGVALAPAAAAQIALWDVAVSGLSAGYFITWLLRLLVKYRAAVIPRLM
jgi:hypothetical protein